MTRTIHAPDGTVEIGASSGVVSGQVAVALRDGATGSFGVWMLDVREGAWTPLGEPDIDTYVTAIGHDGRGTVLVVRLAGRSPKARWRTLEGFSRDIVLPAGARVRSATFDDSAGGFWLGGTFTEGATSGLACFLSDSGNTQVVAEDLATRWLSSSSTSWTGLALRNDSLLIASPPLSEIISLDLASREQSTFCDLQRGLPGFHLASTSTSIPDDADFSGWEAWSAEFDCPMQLVPWRDGVLLKVRRANRLGWSLVEIDASGRIGKVLTLPRERWPFAIGEGWLVVHETQSDAVGSPLSVTIMNWPGLEEAVRQVATTAPAHAVVLCADDQATTEAERMPLLIADAATCVGDTSRELASAATLRTVPKPCRLAILGTEDRGKARAVATTLSKFAQFDGCVSMVRADALAPAESLAPGLWLVKPAAATH